MKTGITYIICVCVYGILINNWNDEFKEYNKLYEDKNINITK